MLSLLASAPCGAQAAADPIRPPRIDDPVSDGILKGALVGAGAMAAVVAVGYANCDAGCEAPAELPMFGVFMGLGAASGAGVGWLIDKLHKAPGPAPVAVMIRADRQERAVRVQWRLGQARLEPASLRSQSQPRVDDSTLNGIVIGASLGTIAGVVTGGVIDDRCGGNLCNNASVQTYLLYGAVGAGSGAVTGWLIDKLHKGHGPAPITMAVRADPEEKAVRLQWRF